MHLPKLSLSARGFRGLSRELRVRMRIGERKIAKGETELMAQLLLKRFHDAVGCAAVRALIIAILQHLDRCVVRTLNVVALRLGFRQFQ